MTDYRDTTGKKSSRQTGFPGADLISGVVEEGEEAYNEGKEAVDEAVSSGGDAIDNVSEDFQETVDDTTSSGGLFGVTGSLIDDTVDEASGGASDIGSSISGGLSSITEGTTDFLAGEGTADDIGGFIDDTVDDAAGGVDDAFGGVENAFDETVGDIGENIPDAGDIGGVVDDATSGLDGFIDEGGSVVDDATEGIDNFLGEGENVVDDALGGVDNFLGDAGSTVDNTIDDALGGAGGAIGSIGDFFGDAGSTTGDIVDDALGMGGDVLDDTGEFGEDILGGGADFVGDVLGGGIDIGSTVAGGAADWVGALGGGAANIAGNIGGSIGQAVGGVVSGGSGGSEPSGSWGEPERFETHGRGVVLVQESSDGGVRYFAITKDDNNNVIALDGAGNGTQLRNAGSMNELPSFSTSGGAESAIEAAGLVNTSNGSGNGDTKKWGGLSKVGTTGRCVIMAQRSTEGNKRFFTFTKNQDGQTVAMDKDGNGVVVDSVNSVSELPHYPTRSDAESACPEEPESPADGGNNGQSDDSSPPQDDEQQWGQLEQESQVGNCVVMKQEDNQGNIRFFTLTKNSNGETVAVASNGGFTPIESVRKMGSLPHYPTVDDAEAACPESEGEPQQGGNEGDTDDSGSQDGQQQDGSDESGQEQPSPEQAGLLSGDIMGVPIPVAAAGALAGAGALSMVLGDEEGSSSARTFTGRRSSRRVTSSSQNRGSTGQNK